MVVFLYTMKNTMMAAVNTQDTLVSLYLLSAWTTDELQGNCTHE